MSKPRVISFYLPQYHPIPENDSWWGKGFTDWINVAKARPRFKGHNQPQIPADLGFYDLRMEEARIAQAKLAEAYGINGFCYYHYWFNGRMLLEKPFNDVLGSGKPDFPFCLCWANENWTRRWDGLDHEILMAQKYEDYDPEMHMMWLKNAFADERYIRVNNKPLLLIYNVSDIPDLKDKIDSWRRIAIENGLKDLYLCAVKSVHNRLSEEEVIALGFDALVDFIPNNEIFDFKVSSKRPMHYFRRIMNIILSTTCLEKIFGTFLITHYLSYRKIAEFKMNKTKSKFKFFPCVIPSWDNTARKAQPHVIQNDDPEIYKLWLKNSFDRVKEYPQDEQIVFINAWNEWAEGCHLEPDIISGKKFLEATLDVKNKI